MAPRSESLTLKTGCIIFDDPLNPEQGWVAESYTEAWRLFKVSQDLPPNFYWLTNLESTKQTLISSEVPATFFPNTHLRESLTQLARRHKLDDPKKLAKFGAQIFKHLSFLAASFGQDLAFNSYPNFKLALNCYLKLPRLKVPKIYDPIIREASVPYTSCLRQKPKTRFSRQTLGAFLLPQAEHGFKILETSLPCGPLKLEEFSPLTSAKDIEDFFLSKPKGFYQVRFLGLNHELSPWLQRGFRPMNLAQTRLWLCTDELEFYNKYASLSLDKALISETSQKITSNLKDHPWINQELDCSLSLSLFLDNLWHSCAFLKVDACVGLKAYFAPFLYAKDRSLLFDRVLKFASLNAEVLGYGNGRIYVNLADLDPKEIFKLALKTKTIPPFLDLRSQDLASLNLSDPSSLTILQRLYALSALDDLLDLDLAVVKSLGGA
ncbi:MAG: hypothetical protein IJU40_00100 [Desulfovibrionaceae bacterium]|nr:hypothetical protein [Desulfovibrionaceae bacterium]